MSKVFDINIINGEQVFYRECYPKHFFIKFNGFGVSKRRLVKLTKKYPTINKFVIDYFGETKHRYISKLDDWLLNSNKYTFKIDDEQLILDLRYMFEEKEKPKVIQGGLNKWMNY